MLREIYQKAESGKKQHTPHSRNRTTIHTSSPTNCKPRTCFLFTGWSHYKGSLPVASPVTSPTTTKYLHPSFAGDEQRPASDSETSNLGRTNGSNRNQSPTEDKRKIVIEAEDRGELVGHVLTEQRVIDGNNNTSEIRTEATDLNNLASLNGSFNNSKESVKRRSSSRSFGRTKSAVKKQLSRLMSDNKESGDLTNRSLANLEHTSHRTSILVSLRAASILLPLYGLHYLVFVYRIETSVCWLSELYHYCSITLDGLQGMLVSILFCFATNEVNSDDPFHSRPRSKRMYHLK